MADMIKNGVHGASRVESYVAPKDPAVCEHLEWFKDQKLALMIHFGIYSQVGIYESWPLSDGDAHWSRKDVDWETDAETFREQYTNLNRSFNPVRFLPEQWADFASEAGFKYLIFTTKHHDGFCMFDSEYTDYKVTAPDCPFHTHKYADIVGSVFDAFRAKGMGISAYFSKPDWHCSWYWAEGMERKVAHGRLATYDPADHPEVWEQFVQFTHNQMMELVTKYGPIDVLWLDGGCVRPQNGQDIRLSELVAKARAHRPQLLVADRTVGGENENIITPEQSIPDTLIPVPWESCVTIGTGFSFRFEDEYKTPRRLVNMLCDVVCRGGNLALNIGPQPDGRLPIGAMRSALGMGEWLKVNGDAIYGTRVCAPYEAGNLAFTKKADSVYVIARLEEGETLSRKLFIPWTEEVGSVTLLADGSDVEFVTSDIGITLTLPESLAETNPIAPAFRLDK